MLLTNSLPDTTTARDRSWAYLPSTGTCPEDGTLAVSETTGKVKVKHVCRKYAVEEQPAFGSPGRVFLLAKLEHKGDAGTKAGQSGMARSGEVYETRVGAGFSSCTCTSGNARKKCVHQEVLADLVASGLADPRESGCDRVPESRERDEHETYYDELFAEADRAIADRRAASAAFLQEACPF